MSAVANSWTQLRVGDLGEVFTGRTPPSGTQGLFGETYPFITPGDMRQGKYARKTDRCLSHDGAALLRRIRLPANSVCVSCIGWQMGEVIITDRISFTNQQINTIVPKAEYDASYLYYTFRLRKQELLSLGSAAGARTPILNKSAFCNLKIRVPSLSMQRRIASILGAYDDLIETNQRRVALLEEMALRLFEEWFVRFRFPGNESHAMVETPDGLLPKGWSMTRLGDLTSYISRGITPAYDASATSLAINQKCIRDQRVSLQLARTQSKPVPKEKLVQSGDVLINSTGVGTLGRVAQAEAIPEGLTVDTHVTIVRPERRLDRDFFGLALLRMEPLLERLGVGATGQTELNRSRIADIGVAEPPSNLQTVFGRHARPLRELAFQLTRQSEGLAASRELLLPRLISGELSVADAERDLKDAA
ncbi:MAG: restriction endonuclease subunit S [Mesorhizobium sp.]|nr:MAG: restriction endonuclease subunit S [Mesorhizobium sp.]